MSERNKLEVKINGQRYVLTSDRPKEELQEVSDFVNDYIKQFQKSSIRFNKLSQLTLAILNMGMEYMALKKEIETTNAKLEEVKNHYQKAHDDHHDSKKELQDLKEKLDQLSKTISSKDEEIAKLKKEKKELDDEIETLAGHFQTRKKMREEKSNKKTESTKKTTETQPKQAQSKNTPKK